jgi:tetratricopeptide (TPR) repeat protein
LVELERFGEAFRTRQPEHVLLRHHATALDCAERALDTLPRGAIKERAVTHNALATIHGTIGDFWRSLEHSRRAIALSEDAGNLYEAAVIRFNAAVNLLHAGDLETARDYAQAALRGYELAADSVEPAAVRGLLAEIEAAHHPNAR